uniref:IMV membrane protein virion maturation n=1 Tax=Rousettus bat poxvirus TaxID=3141933 RepID=A0AAU7E2A1_9POXV
MTSDIILIIISVVVIALLVYAAYRRERGPVTTPKSVVDELVEADTVFKDELTPDQIRAMHRFFTSAG